MRLRLFGREITLFRWRHPAVRWVVVGFLAAFVSLLLLQECRGADLELGLGGASANSLRPQHIDAPLFKGALVLDERWELAVRYFKEQYEVVDDYWMVSATRLATVSVGPLEPFLGLGVAYAERNALLAQEFNFSLVGGVRWGQFALEVHHVSNAGMKEPNRGQNSYVLTIRQEF